MKKILDQNMAGRKRSELNEYLSDGNEIIIIDEFMLELCKCSRLEINLKRQLEILKKFPEQVLVTHARGIIINKEIVKARPLEQNDLISSDSTKIFRQILALNDYQIPDFTNDLLVVAEPLLKDKVDFLEEHLRPVIIKAEKLISKKSGQKKEYETYTDKKLRDIHEVSAEVLTMFLSQRGLSNEQLNHFKNCKSFILSFIFTHLWRVVDWAVKGGARNSRKKINGDSFDLTYVLISCFFDGILTGEKWLEQCRKETLKTIN
jgi:hypothetical protein